MRVTFVGSELNPMLAKTTMEDLTRNKQVIVDELSSIVSVLCSVDDSGNQLYAVWDPLPATIDVLTLDLGPYESQRGHADPERIGRGT